MHISWLGLSAFKFETRGVVVVTDPYAPAVAARPLRVKADIVTVSRPASPAHGHVAAVMGEPFVISTPGEFEVRGVFVRGIPSGSAEATNGETGSAAASTQRRAAVAVEPVPTLFTFDCEGLRLAHLGGVRRVPPSDALERLGDVDVLFLPVGGGETLAPDAAMRVVNAVEPLAVVPMHVEQKGLKLGSKLLPPTAFLREIGASKVEPIERLSLKRKDLDEEETKVFLFRP